jgi:hypothetical protein
MLVSRNQGALDERISVIADTIESHGKTLDVLLSRLDRLEVDAGAEKQTDDELEAVEVPEVPLEKAIDYGPEASDLRPICTPSWKRAETHGSGWLVALEQPDMLLVRPSKKWVIEWIMGLVEIKQISESPKEQLDLRGPGVEALFPIEPWMNRARWGILGSRAGVYGRLVGFQPGGLLQSTIRLEVVGYFGE